MNSHADKTQHNNKSVANEVSHRQSSGGSTFQFVDNRPETRQLRKVQEMANNSPRVKQLKAYQKTPNNPPQAQLAVQQHPIQKQLITTSAFNHSSPIQLLEDSEITARFGINGISKANVIYRRNNRPSYADGQVEAVWEAAKNGAGRVFCPNTGKELFWDKSLSRATQWHMGHKTGHEYNALWESLATCGLTWTQFLAAYQNPNNYQAEDPAANLSHAYEAY